MARACLTLLLSVALSGRRWQANSRRNKDLELIPKPVQPLPNSTAEASPRPAQTGKLYLENASAVLRGAGSYRPPRRPPIGRSGCFSTCATNGALERPQPDYSGRLNLRARISRTSQPRERDQRSARGYASWSRSSACSSTRTINIKSGVALGFNPTTSSRRAQWSSRVGRSVVLREDRLGTADVRLQRIWAGGSLTACTRRRLLTSRSTPI